AGNRPRWFDRLASKDMTLRGDWYLRDVSASLFFFLAPILLFAPSVRAESSQALDALISQRDRLVVLSPHPDDETLAAGGLIQRVLQSGGKVKVVFLTSGDGYPEGVE